MIGKLVFNREKSGTSRLRRRIVYQRRVSVDASPAEIFAIIRKIGGKNGWYYANWLWKLRGRLDRMVGGVGLREGRRHPSDLEVGDVIDWWRVEGLEEGRLLLHAEMKVPGRAWLELSVDNHRQRPEIVQTAVFDPAGVWGLAYWYGTYPVHALVFRGMLRNMSRLAQGTKSCHDGRPGVREGDHG